MNSCGNVLQLILIASVATWSAVTYGDYIYPAWTTAVGWCLALSSLLPIPVTAAIKIYTSTGTSLKNVCCISNSHDSGNHIILENVTYLFHGPGFFSTIEMHRFYICIYMYLELVCSPINCNINPKGITITIIIWFRFYNFV